MYRPRLRQPEWHVILVVCKANAFIVSFEEQMGGLVSCEGRACLVRLKHGRVILRVK